MSAPLTAETYTAWANYLSSASTSSLSWFLQVELYGGANSAIMNVSSDATAFPFRDSLFVMQLYASSANAQPPYPYDDGYNFLKGVVDTIEGSMPGADFGAYTNYIDPTLENWQDLYYKGNYDRLVELQKVCLVPCRTLRNCLDAFPAWIGLRPEQHLHETPEHRLGLRMPLTFPALFRRSHKITGTHRHVHLFLRLRYNRLER